jgi:hypothetical protein
MEECREDKGEGKERSRIFLQNGAKVRDTLAIPQRWPF